MNSPILQVDGLVSGYGTLRVIKGASLQVCAGDVAAILGPNGAGKSTLLTTLAGALPAEEGEIRLFGEDISSMSASRRLALGIGWVPEGRNVFLDLPVKDNLYLSARRAGLRNQFNDLVADVIRQFPVLGNKFNALAGALSGGEQQILALARLLVRKPKVALLDEPSMGLGPQIVDTLRDAVRASAAEGMAWLVTEQNVEWLKSVATKGYLMEGGHLKEESEAEVVMEAERLQASYFGDVKS